MCIIAKTAKALLCSKRIRYLLRWLDSFLFAFAIDVIELTVASYKADQIQS